MLTGFIGCGNMASAIIKGMVSSGSFEAEQIAVYDIDAAKAAKLSEKYGCRCYESAKSIASGCDAVVLAVKPNVIRPLLEQLTDSLEENDPVILSIAAGKSIEFIEDALSYRAKVIRVMPNINAEVLSAVSAYCCNREAAGEKDFAKRFCESFGAAVELEEKYFPVFGVIGGCSPAYAYMFIDAMARAAVKNGMPKAVALEISAAAVLGSAKMVQQSDECPWSLVDKVCSPGGTTIEGVLSLQRDGFEAAVANAVQVAVDKDAKV